MAVDNDSRPRIAFELLDPAFPTEANVTRWYPRCRDLCDKKTSRHNSLNYPSSAKAAAEQIREGGRQSRTDVVVAGEPLRELGAMQVRVRATRYKLLICISGDPTTTTCHPATLASTVGDTGGNERSSTFGNTTAVLRVSATLRSD